MEDKIESCQLCGSLCRIKKKPTGECYYAPFLDHELPTQAKERVIEMLRESRFCEHKLHVAIDALKHVQEFLQSKGHKIMYLQVKECLKSIEEPVS